MKTLFSVGLIVISALVAGCASTAPNIWADKAKRPPAETSYFIDAFEDETGCPVIINTSFNVRGEPIVCTPEDAYRCFMRTEMDYLVMENVLLHKEDQPEIADDESWKTEFELD